VRGFELLIAALAAFYILGLVAGIILVYAISAVRLYRAAVRRRRQERLYGEMLARRQWYGYAAQYEGDPGDWPRSPGNPPPPPPDGNEGTPPRWPSG
jgi:hypothetical protein